MYLYILYSAEHRRHYIGIAEDIGVRLAKHNAGDVRSTKPYRPWQVLYKEEYASTTDARRREIYLKTHCRARQELVRQIHSGPIV